MFIFFLFIFYINKIELDVMREFEPHRDSYNDEELYYDYGTYLDLCGTTTEQENVLTQLIEVYLTEKGYKVLLGHKEPKV